jgi:hypothetical protein
MDRIRKTESQPSAGWNRRQAQLIIFRIIVYVQQSLVKWATHRDHFAGSRNFEFPKTSPGCLLDGPANLTSLDQITIKTMSADRVP